MYAWFDFRRPVLLYAVILCIINIIILNFNIQNFPRLPNRIKLKFTHSWATEISSVVVMGTGGIPTTDNIPETIERYIVSGTLSVGHPSFLVVSGILSVVGFPPVPIPIPEEIQLLMYEFAESKLFQYFDVFSSLVRWN